jgi:tetratricopeptide (TPR) repeat protein
VAKFPNFRRAWKNLAQIHFRQGHFKASVGAFSKVLQLGGGDGITYGLMGVAHARMSSPIAAESAFRLAMMHDPDTIDWKLGLAESFFKQRRYADAVTLFDKLIELKPERAQLWLAQGEAFARMGKPMKAAENFEVVDQLGASTAGSLFNLADIYANEKLYDLATSAYVRALEKDPTAKVDRVIRAAKFLSMSNAMDEMEALVDGIERARADSLSKDEKKELLKLRARLAVSRGAGEQEAAVLLEIVKLDPLDGDALILLGQHSARGGDVERAILYYEQAASIEKFEADAKVRHAQLLVRERRYDEALPLLRRAQTIKPRENIARYLEQVERVAKANRGR